jgi:serpin B
MGTRTETGANRSKAAKRRFVVGGSALAAAAVAGAVAVALAVLPGGPHPGPGGITRVDAQGGAVQLVSSAAPLSDAANPAGAAAVAAAEQRFALALTEEAYAKGTGPNPLVSPMSAAVDLAMLELGSGPSTAGQLAATLRSTGLSPAVQAEGWASIVRSMTAAAAPGELQMADSLWLERHLAVQPAFLDALARTFGNQTYQVDFRTLSATAAINSWVDRATAGRIPQLFSPGDLPQATELVLANALHFHGSWADGAASALAEATVEPRPFETAAGTPVPVPTVVARGAGLDYAVTAGWTAAELPYQGGRLAALLVEPPAGTMPAFLSSLASTGLGRVLASLTHGTADFSMPELRLSQKGSLDPVLSAMGLAPAYQEADFSPMLGVAGRTGQAIGTVHQAVTLDVNRYGTDAAAATGVAVVGSAVLAAPSVAFDHPYLFLIRDTVTGTVLFSCVVQDPAAG